MAKANDKFWLFGVRAHQDDIYLRPGAWGQARGTRITPAEGAFMLGVPNLMMIQCDGDPAPFSVEARQYCESFTPLKRVLWSSTGSGGFRTGNEEEFIVQLARDYPNVMGTYLDDFFGRFGKITGPDFKKQALAELHEIRRKLDAAPRRLDIYVTWYTHEFSGVDHDIIDCIDGLTLWTWRSEELEQLAERYERIEKAFPRHRKLLGVYMYDFASQQPITVERMELQCELGLRLLREGRLDGMIFEANSVMGLRMPSELWLRKWLDKVRDIDVP